MPDLIVVHYTAMADWTRARDWLCNPQAEVSAHYILSPQGEVVPLVDEAARAWHAGAGAWGDITDVNSRSIGIELSNDGAQPFAAPLMDALEILLGGIMDRWAIPPERVIGHSDLAPGRKIDPGLRFDWARLLRGGYAVSSEVDRSLSGPVDADRFLEDLRAIGYTAPVTADVLLAAFRLRHRQTLRPIDPAQTPLDAVDCAIAADLAARFPIAKFRQTS